MKARKWVVRSHFVGQPKREDLEIVEEELPPIKDGGQGVGEGGFCEMLFLIGGPHRLSAKEFITIIYFHTL